MLSALIKRSRLDLDHLEVQLPIISHRRHSTFHLQQAMLPLFGASQVCETPRPILTRRHAAQGNNNDSL